MTIEGFPLQQGSLDFLCSIYAVINMMERHGEFRTLDQAAIPFRVAILKAQASADWDLAATITKGLNEEDIEELIGVMLYGEVETIQQPTLDNLKNMLEKENNVSRRGIIVSLYQDDELIHHSVVKEVTDDKLPLHDSYGCAHLHRKGNTLMYQGKDVQIGWAYRLYHEA